MKKEYLIMLIAGIAIAYIIWKNKEPEPQKVIRPGDKGDEVFGLQKALTNLAGVKLPNMGVYDNETLSAVQYYLKGSNHLADYENGYIDKKFAADLYQISNGGKKD